MSTTSENFTTAPVLIRHFESSRHQRANCIAAFEQALPVIRRRPDQGPAPRRTAIVTWCSRSASK